MGLDFIHSYLLKRMAAVAEEIFDAVKDSVVEYEQEIERLKEENCFLRSTLTQNTNDSPEDGGPLGSEVSEIQVKMEVAAMTSHESTSHASTMTSTPSEESQWQETPHRLSLQPNVLLNYEDDGGLHSQSLVTVKTEPCDAEADHSHSSAVQFSSVELQLYNQAPVDTSPKPVQHQKSLLMCRFCRRTFVTKGRLLNHILVHKNEAHFSCDWCGSSFKSRFHLKEHEKLHAESQAEERSERVSHMGMILQPDGANVDTSPQHPDGSNLYSQRPGKYPYYCKTCDRPFTRQKTLQNHMLLHRNDRNYSCMVCGRKFHKSWHLAEHLRIHTGEKPFGCDNCGKRFVQWNQARSHIMKHHDGDMSLLSKR